MKKVLKKSKREQIIVAYKERSKIQKVRLDSLAQEFHVNKGYVSRCIKEFKEETKKNLYKEIKQMYYVEKKSISIISGLLNCSQPTIRKILQEDSARFNKEKEDRKIKSQQRRSEQKKLDKKVNRTNNGIDVVMVNLMRLQQNNALEMSTNRKISTNDMYKNNIQQYEVKPCKKGTAYCAKLKKEIRDIAANDVPTTIYL